MGVVETHQTFSARSVQRQPVAYAMWTGSSNFAPVDFELDPIATMRIDDEHLIVQIEQNIQTVILYSAHVISY